MSEQFQYWAEAEAPSKAMDGFLDGIDNILNSDNLEDNSIKRKISYWFQKKIGQDANVFFTLQISNYYKEKSDEELKIVLINLLKEYFTQNPLGGGLDSAGSELHL